MIDVILVIISIGQKCVQKLNVGGKMNEPKILNQLIAEGKVTEDEVAQAKAKSAIAEFDRDIVETIHTVLCGSDHDTGECQWYVEEQFPNTWELTYHRLWTTFVSNPIKLIPESTSKDLTSSTYNPDLAC